MKRTSTRCALGLCLILGLLTVLPLVAQESAKEGKILFVDTSEPGRSFLALMAPDGTGKTRLTPAYDNIVFPRLCETSGWIGFTNKRPDMKSEVYLLNRDGTKIKKILENAALECFSPNGKFILYTTCDEKAELYSYSIETKRATKISQDLRVTAADWSPQGNWIAASVLTSAGTNDLYLISTLGQGIERLTETPDLNESFPVFTSDAKYLAFISNRHGANEIEYLDLEKKAVQRPLISGMYPTISPTGKWIAFQNGDMVGISQSDGLYTRDLAPGRTPWWIK